jgi:hypothetical protein
MNIRRISNPRLACAIVCAGSLLLQNFSVAENGAKNQLGASGVRAVYYEGSVVSFTPVPAGRFQREFRVGPWQFGRLSRSDPKDSRLNLYLVAPGAQYHDDRRQEYDHNEIVSAVPATASTLDWDVYYAVVLDPALRADFRSERELILAQQDNFTPGDSFDFDTIPGQSFLRAVMHIDSLQALASYRVEDGTLPRLLIVPAHSVVRASIPPSSVAESATAPHKSN